MGNYVFVDGGYLRARFKQAMTRYYQTVPQIKIQGLSDAFDYVSNPLWTIDKLFYYDCSEDEAKPSQSNQDFELTRQEQEQRHEAIRSVAGWHVREGRMAGSRKGGRSQKRVDVLLTVEMMNHSIAKNAKKVILIAGDDDFTPLVDELIRHGTYVEVWSDKACTSKYLSDSADRSVSIDFWFLWFLMPSVFQSSHPIPLRDGLTIPPPFDNLKWGRGINGRPIQLSQSGDQYYFCVGDASESRPLIRSNDPDLTERLAEDDPRCKELKPWRWEGKR